MSGFVWYTDFTMRKGLHVRDCSNAEGGHWTELPKATREAAGAKAELRKARPVATERSGRVRPKNKKEVEKWLDLEIRQI